MARSALPVAALCVATVLSACSTMSAVTPAASGGADGFDYLKDDVASLLVALDVPLGIEPQAEGPRFVAAVNAASGRKEFAAVLVRADAEPVFSVLPAPLDGRTYYVYGFAPADQAALRALQASARGETVSTVSVEIVPKLCATTGTVPAGEKLSILAVLPGRPGLSPLVSEESVTAMLARTGQPALPACAGHSG